MKGWDEMMVITKKGIFGKVLMVCIGCMIFVGMQNFSSIAIDKPGESRENPILINSAGDFDAVMEDMEDGETFEGKFLKLNKNIFLVLGKNKLAVEAYWEDGDNTFLRYNKQEPSEKIFKGFFDGNGKTMHISMPDNREERTSLIFDVIGKNAVVQDLKITTALPRERRGPLAAIICNVNYGLIKDCTIRTDFRGLNVVAKNRGEMQNCSCNPGLMSTIQKLFHF